MLRPSIALRSDFHFIKATSSFRILRVLIWRSISVFVALSLLITTTPAAARTVVDTSAKWRADWAFWIRANNITSRLWNVVTLQNAAPKRQETQDERDARVHRIEIFPGDLTVHQGQEVNFAAIAYDAENNPVGGVKFNWTEQDEDRNRNSVVIPRGHFKAKAHGNFKVTVEGAGRTARVKVKVIEGKQPRKNDQPIEVITTSSRDLPGVAGKLKQDKRKLVRSESPNPVGSPSRSGKFAGPKSGSTANTKLAHASSTAATPVFLNDGWGPDNYWSADDPGNTRGDPPGSPVDSGSGSANFQFAAPVLGLPGRGIDISLGLVYNSRLWNKAGNDLNFDIDRDWPAPGWSFGFGKLVGIGVYVGSMLIDADGTRHPYTGTINVYPWGTTFNGYTTDGSFIDYSYQTGTNGILLWAQAKHPNGTTVFYNVNGPGGLFPSTIMDANGNYINITYVNNTGPRIQTVTDTMGRSITFHYDSLTRLTAITAPGLGSGTRTLIRLHYSQLALNYSFEGSQIPVVRDYYPWVVDAIYYPGTGTGYWLSQADNSYSSYGMLKKVSERRGMTFSGPDPVPPGQGTTEQGTITAGVVTKEEVYNYPLNPSDTTGTQASNLTDAPTYTSCTETWSRDGTNFDSATTAYQVFQNSSPRTVTITLPNGTISKQYSHNAPGSYLDGLVFLDETRSGSTVLQSSSTQWEPGAYSSPRPSSITATNELGQSTTTQFSYGTVYNQVTDVRNYDYDGITLLRSMRKQYQNSSVYTSRHIFNLPLVLEIFAGNNVTRLSRTEYQYDFQPMTAAPNVVQHDQSFNPHADAEGFCYWDYDWSDPDCTGGCWDYNCDGYCPQYYVCPYNSATDFRGNLTQITSYADAINLTGSVSESRRYDVTGNLVTSTVANEQVTFSYTIATQFAYLLTETSGSATDPYLQVTSSSTYDFNTGITLSTTDANGRTSQTICDAATLRPQTATLPTGAHTDYVYDDAAMSITETTYLESHPTHSTIADQNVKLFNGRGLIRQEKGLAAGGAWDLIDTTYDSMGRMSQQTKPYRSGETQQWTTNSYDALGRVVTVQTADNSTIQSFYNEANRPSVASTTPGETLRIVDAWGRERWARGDALGRLVEVVEPDAGSNGSVATNGSVTTYSYNPLGDLTNVTQGTQGAQTRTFKYDSLSRLTAQKMAEASATLNDAGTYVGAGAWSEVFTYDERSNMISRTDARGVKTIFTFNNDPLNRLQSVSWDTSGFGDTGNPILPAATVSYQYRTKSYGAQLIDVTQTSSITAGGVSTESFSYDSEGRVSAKVLTLNSRPSYPLATDYILDSLDRLSDIQYPTEYGNGSQVRRLAHHNYDIASRINGLTVDGQSHGSNIAYNAASQVTSLNVGLSGANQITENFSYNSQTGLLEGQTVMRGGTTLLNLGYDYRGANDKRTGQLTKILNNLDHNKDRGFEYDSLGRLKRATGGQNANWVQRYEYDRYGNRHNAYSYVAEEYVRNFYQNALNRQPTSTELNNWLSTLQSAYAQGSTSFLTAMQNLGEAIFTDPAYNEPDNREYVKDLYRTYLHRESDQGGEDHWTSEVPVNGRAAVRAGFAWSPEFNVKVSGISPFSPGGTVPRDGAQGLTFDAGTNRIANAGWYYDAAGNQTRTQRADDTWQRYQYDAANRLVQIKTDSGSIVAAHTYGDSNQRLVTEESGTRTYYLADRGSVLAEYTEVGASTVPVWSKSFVYLGARLITTLEPNGAGAASVQYHHPDQLGTRLVTNAQNTTYFEQVALPFGTALDSQSTGATTRRFTSYDRSLATKLDYAVNRHYDPQQGRFTQVDPIDMDAVDLDNPQTLNLYAYCANDPVNSADPSGLGFFSFFKKLFKGIWKVLTSKWFLIAVMVALTVITIGANLNLWALSVTKGVNISTGAACTLGTPGCLGGAFAVSQVTTLGWVAGALSTAAALPGITNLKGLLRRAVSFGIGRAVGIIGQALSGIGSISPGGTPDWNPEVADFQRVARRPPPRRGQRGYRGPGSWHYGLGRPPVRRIPPPPVGYSAAYPRDYPTSQTVNRSAQFRSEGEARVEAMRKMGPAPVEVERGKWRSFNGRWQYRAKPGDVGQNHVHLERLDPATGRVLENWHFRWPAGQGRR